jgi:hypothetical protein
MTPEKFKEKWGVTNGELMTMLSQSSETVSAWFNKGKRHRDPSASVCERLTFLDVQWSKWLIEESGYDPYVRSLFEIVKNRRIVNGK